jgi:hypothetical protein
MKTKTTKILYWTFTILLCLMLFADGFGGITQQQAGQDALKHLGCNLATKIQNHKRMGVCRSFY